MKKSLGDIHNPVSYFLPPHCIASFQERNPCVSMRVIGMNARFILYKRTGSCSHFSKTIFQARPASSYQSRLDATRRLVKRVDLRTQATPKRISGYFVLLAGIGVIVWHWQDLRHIFIATQRSARIAIVATRAVLDYRNTYGKVYTSEEERLEAISQCHTRCATITLHALLANGGVFIKLGQHLSSSIILPIEWQKTLRPCLDACEESTLAGIEDVFYEDTGMHIDDVFSEFSPRPIGVASLAQVHTGIHRATGMKVAVKIQHPGLQEFAAIDLISTDVTLRIVKRIFPDFEFSWLGREMRENLPLEMNFMHEASNAARVTHNFESIPDSPLYIPRVLSSTKRTLVMEFIEGAKIDDKEYLAVHGIDRNKVSQELCKIFSEQVYIHGFFHADPHQGNLLIRPSNRTGGHNFDIVLLDHGLYFDIPHDLRLNYARFWLSLLSPPTEKNRQNRQKYASLVGGDIGPERYNVFEAALTGRPTGTFGGGKKQKKGGRLAAFQQAASMLDMGNMNDADMDKLRVMLVSNGDIMVAMFDILRRLDSKVLMLLKLNELTRALDHALSTTHPPYRVFLIVAQYCNRAVWEDDRLALAKDYKMTNYLKRWFAFQVRRLGFGTLATWMDLQASLMLTKAWIRGLFTLGLEGAWRARAGLQ